MGDCCPFDLDAQKSQPTLQGGSEREPSKRRLPPEQFSHSMGIYGGGLSACQLSTRPEVVPPEHSHCTCAPARPSGVAVTVSSQDTENPKWR